MLFGTNVGTFTIANRSTIIIAVAFILTLEQNLDSQTLKRSGSCKKKKHSFLRGGPATPWRPWAGVGLFWTSSNVFQA